MTKIIRITQDGRDDIKPVASAAGLSVIHVNGVLAINQASDFLDLGLSLITVSFYIYPFSPSHWASLLVCKFSSLLIHPK